MLLALFRRIFRTLAPCLAALLAFSLWAQNVPEHHGTSAHAPAQSFHGPVAHPAARDFHAPVAHGYAAHEHYRFHGRDVRRFGRDDLLRWRGGRWNNTCFGGRCGWWWLSGGLWYFYTRPVYPYPAIVSGIQYGEPVVVEPAPVVIPAPIEQPPMQVAPAPQFRYYCDNPQGYFPAVQNCNTQFRQVAVPPPR